MSATERWDAFLAQIEGRHRLVREESLAAAQATLASLPGADISPLTLAWGAVNSRLQELESRIIDTWHEKVEAAFEAEGLDGVRIGAYDKGDSLRFALENEREALQQRILADAARHFFARALAGRRDCFCTACGAQLNVPLVFRAVSLQCGRCGAVGVFEPGELLRGVAAVGAHALAQEAAWGPWRRARCRCSRSTSGRRSPTGAPTSRPGRSSSRSSVGTRCWRSARAWRAGTSTTPSTNRSGCAPAGPATRSSERGALRTIRGRRYRALRLRSRREGAAAFSSSSASSRFFPMVSNMRMTPTTRAASATLKVGHVCSCQRQTTKSVT
jgi:hypothetical protein